MTDQTDNSTPEVQEPQEQDLEALSAQRREAKDKGLSYTEVRYVHNETDHAFTFQETAVLSDGSTIVEQRVPGERVWLRGHALADSGFVGREAEDGSFVFSLTQPATQVA